MITSTVTAQSTSTSGTNLASYQPISLSSSNMLSSIPLSTITPLSNTNTESESCINFSVISDFNRIVSSNLRSTHEQIKNSISVNLTACKREINFLRMIDRKAPLLYEKKIVENAIRRYETYWLPMQAAKPDVNNIPPLDVHWIWHCHMLSPTDYEKVILLF